jgi:hypothetical protein
MKEKHQTQDPPLNDDEEGAQTQKKCKEVTVHQTRTTKGQQSTNINKATLLPTRMKGQQRTNNKKSNIHNLLQMRNISKIVNLHQTRMPKGQGETKHKKVTLHQTRMMKWQHKTNHMKVTLHQTRMTNGQRKTNHKPNLLQTRTI